MRNRTAMHRKAKGAAIAAHSEIYLSSHADRSPWRAAEGVIAGLMGPKMISRLFSFRSAGFQQQASP